MSVNVEPEDHTVLIDSTHKLANSIAPLANGILTLQSWADGIDPDDAESKSAKRRMVVQKSVYLGTMYNLCTILENATKLVAADWEKVFASTSEDEDDDEL